MAKGKYCYIEINGNPLCKLHGYLLGKVDDVFCGYATLTSARRTAVALRKRMSSSDIRVVEGDCPNLVNLSENTEGEE